MRVLGVTNSKSKGGRILRKAPSRSDDSNQLLTHSPSSAFWDILVSRRNVRRLIGQNGYHEISKDEMLAMLSGSATKRLGARSSIGSNPGIKGNYSLHHSSAYSFQLMRNERRNDHFANLGPKTFQSPFISERLSSLPKVLRENQLYFVKTGRGNCAIFNRQKFYPPFLGLYGQSSGVDFPSGTEELPVRLPPGYRDIARLFRQQWNEQTFLKSLHFCGAFRSLIERISRRGKGYVLGPAGPRPSRFPFWMKNDQTGRLVPFIHEGTADMDDCLYAKDKNLIFPIEAKLKHIPDLSWHKLAFPCYRFIRQPSNPGEWLAGSQEEDALHSEQRRQRFMFSMDPLDWYGKESEMKRPKIMPVYCTSFKEYDSWKRGAVLYIFPEVQIHTGKVPLLSANKVSGVILNDRKQMTPARMFRVDLSWLRKG